MDKRLTRWALRLPAANVVCAQIAALTTAVASGHLLQGRLNWPWWSTVALTCCVGMLFVATMRGRLLTDWLTWRLRTSAPQTGTTVDVLAEGHTHDGAPLRVGIHHCGGEVSAVLELTPSTIAASAFGVNTYTGANSLPLRALATALTQHDITLAGIDIVVHGQKAATNHEVGRIYSRLVEPLPAAAARRAWVVLRLDPRTARTAVARRGGGDNGARRTLILAALRVQRALVDEEFTTTLLTAQQLRAHVRTLTRGTELTQLTAHRRSVELPGCRVNGFAIGARSLTADQLLRLWTPPSAGTLLTLQLRPNGRDQVKLTGLSHHFTETDPATGKHPVIKPIVDKHISLRGRQAHGLRAALPLGGPRIRHLTGNGGLLLTSAAELDALHIPASGCGQLLGADDRGRAVTVRIASPEVHVVRVSGALHLTQQIVLRALATGAAVHVHSVRRHAWQQMMDTVANDCFTFADSPPPRSAGPKLLVLDGAYTAPSLAGTTLLQVDEQGTTATDLLPDPDIHIRQQPGRRSHITVALPGHSMELSLVSLPEELGYLARPTRHRGPSQGHSRTGGAAPVRPARPAAAHPVGPRSA